MNTEDKLIRAVTGLREIMKGEGRFSMDHKKHAENTIEDMKELAKNTLIDIGAYNVPNASA